MSNADVTIHLDAEPSDALLADIQGRITSLPGVIDATLSERHRHLMVVRFDSHKVHTDRILEAVKRTGVGAELVGL